VAFLAALGGGGGLSGQTSQTAQSGNNDVRAATGHKNINIGGNPNVAGVLQSPLALAAIVLVAYLWLRRK